MWFLQAAVGGMLSLTVTVAVQVLRLPCVSVTVRVTVLLPWLLQSKVLGSTETRLVFTQLSVALR